MVLKRFLVGPKIEGEKSDLKPFFLSENAYSKMENAFVFKGRLKKKFGYSSITSSALGSKVCVSLGSTDENGYFSATVPGSVFEEGQLFGVGNDLFTVFSVGDPHALLPTNYNTAGDFNTITGELSLYDCDPNTEVFFYPNQPIMGICTRKTNQSKLKDNVFFDTQFAYKKLGLSFSRLGTATWTGSDSDFFWSCNYRGANPYNTNFYVSNFVDNLRYISDEDQLNEDWETLYPQLDTDGTRFLETSLILIPFKDRLLTLNTVEKENGSIQYYVNRCRFCQSGDPTDTTNAWIDTVSGKGGYIDAPITEKIVSAANIKDRLIVYFENSTWEIVYTGNFTMPFKWQQINSEMGSLGTFSTVCFDANVLTVGKLGITSCDGVNVNRIDEKNPEKVFKIEKENDGEKRVFGIRDFYNECVYWAFPNSYKEGKFPTDIFVFNYKNNTWSTFNDSFTCFGYVESIDNTTWDTLPYKTWDEWNVPWDSPTQDYGFSRVVAGNQQGFVFILENDRSSNDESLNIYDIGFLNGYGNFLSIKNHNLETGDYIKISNAQGVEDFNEQIFKVTDASNSNAVFFDGPDFYSDYFGGGFVTKINNINIKTSQFNFASNIGKGFRFLYIDFLLTKTSSGEFSINCYTDTNSSSVHYEAEEGSLLGTNVVLTKPEELHPIQENQSEIWHRYFLNMQGKFIQLEFFLSDEQIKNADVSSADFELHGFVFYASAEGDLM